MTSEDDRRETNAELGRELQLKGFCERRPNAIRRKGIEVRCPSMIAEMRSSPSSEDGRRKEAGFVPPGNVTRHREPANCEPTEGIGGRSSRDGPTTTRR